MSNLFKVISFGGLASLCAALCVAPASGQQPTSAASHPAPVSAYFGNTAEPSTPGISLYSRFVATDASLPLPAGGGFYVFTNDALTLAHAGLLQPSGARLLGVVGPRCYAFAAEGSPGAMADALRATGIVTGTALTVPADRVLPEAAPFLEREGVLPCPITVGFWEFASAAEVRELLGAAAQDMRLPLDENAPLLDERFVTLATDCAGLQALCQSPLVASIGFATAGVPLNRAAAAVNRSDQVQGGTSYNLSGSGVALAQWDNGDCDDSHADFGSRITKVTTSTPIGPTGGNFEHATHVAGTMIGSGAADGNARGMATGATLKFYTFSTSSVPTQRRQSKHNYYIEWDNHSWRGTGTNWGLYNSRAQEYDTDCRDLLMMGSQASGDSADTGQISVNWGGQTRLFDSLAEEASAKNMLVVGGHDDNGTDRYVYSSRGPTNDGRLKPDISTNGVGLYSCSWNQGGPSNTYITLSGTSMSAPVATGILAQLSQLYRQQNNGLRLPPDVAKVVLIHTARDRINPAIQPGGSSGNLDNPGPDFTYGYGVVDAKASADLLLADIAAPGKRIIRGGLKNSEVLTYTCTVPAGAPELRLSLCWIDSTAGGTASKQLVNDLDLEVLDPGNVQKFPWTLNAAQPHTAAVQTARNGVDNVEQVLVANPAAGTWTIRVRGFSVNDVSNPVQGFALASSHNLSNNAIRVVNAASVSGSGVALSGTPQDLTFSVTGTGNVGAVRVYLDVLANSRGGIAATLIHPDNTQVALKNVDAQTRQDLFAIFPDSKTPVGNLGTLAGKAVSGTWKVRISGTSGDVVRLAAIEIDSNAPGGGGPTPPTISTSSLPNGTVSTFYSSTLAASGGTAPYSWAWSAQSGSSIPPGLSCSSAGAITGTPTVAGTYNVTVTVTDGASQSAPKNFTITIGAGAALTVTTSSLLGGQVGTFYSATLAASGGAAPYSWSWAAQAGSSIPPGLACNANGTISGTPTVAGTFNVTVTVTDSASQNAQRNLSITITSSTPSALVVNTTSLPTGTTGSSYFTTLSASGGTPPYSWSWSGSVPPGLNCSAAGAISGNPSAAGNYSVTVTVMDSASQSAQRALSLNVIAGGGGPTPPVITTGGLPSGTVGTAYGAALGASGGTVPYSWSWAPDTGSIIPPGLNCDASGNVTGTPTLAGTFSVIVTVTDSASLSSQAQMTLTVAPGSGGTPGPGLGLSAGSGGGGGCTAGSGSSALLLALALLTITIRWRRKLATR